MRRSSSSRMQVMSLLLLMAFSSAQVTIPATPVAAVVATPVATAAPTVVPTPIATATPTATPAATPRATTTPVAANTTSPPPASPPPPKVAPPPPPPGFGSDKTAVFMAIKLQGEGLLPFNSSLGQKFVGAIGGVLGVSSSKVGIRSWTSSSGRRLLATDSVIVQSATLFGSGEAAAQGLETLQAADASGSLQAALRSSGLSLDTATLQSSTTALPSNFQPLGSAGSSNSGLKWWAILVIAVVGAIVLLSLVLCCCWRCLCCCSCFKREVDEEETLPNMKKFGSLKEQPILIHQQHFAHTRGLNRGTLPTAA